METSAHLNVGTAGLETAIDGRAVLRICGQWKLGLELPRAEDLIEKLRAVPQIRQLCFNTEALENWDSSLLIFLLRLNHFGKESDIEIQLEALPSGINRLLELSLAVPERKGARRTGARAPFFARVGSLAISTWSELTSTLTFIGEAFIAFIKFLTGRARFRRSDLFLTIQDTGVQALPIVSLISLLVGLILAFIGAIQLRTFGAQIYVADLVGIAMTREMGAVMTGIIMAGRTGASFAAQLGTMVVNEEVDSLETLGISPMEFLVLPRILALVLMMPLLCLYADLMGILGGFLVGVTMLDLNAVEYFNQTREALRLNDVFIGVFMSCVFGVLIAQAGCRLGLRCGRSSSAVGQVTTSAVVSGIVSIIVATAVITVICDVLGL